MKKNNFIPMAERPQDRKKRKREEKISLLKAKVVFWLIVLMIIFASCTAWAKGY
jgi:cell division septal protein FtsQ